MCSARPPTATAGSPACAACATRFMDRKPRRRARNDRLPTHVLGITGLIDRRPVDGLALPLPLAGEVASHRKMRCGWGLSHKTRDIARGDTLTPTLSRKRERERSVPRSKRLQPETVE